MARLKPGVTLEQAQAKLLASASAFRDRFRPAAMPPTGGFSAITLQESLVRQARPTLLVALGAVGFVLLIACANVANLLLIRATGRRRELAVRAALGAGRWRIMRQLLTESLMLSFAGGVLGLLAGYAGMRWLLTVNTAGLPRLGQGGSLLGMDWRIVVFTVVLSIVTGIVFGLIPALVASRTDLNAVIKDASSRSGSGFRQNKTRSVLVLVEVSLAVVLLVGASLLIRTSLSLSTVDPGYTTENVLVMRTSLTGQQYQNAAVVDETARLALERIRALPGVAAASMTCCIPLQGGLGLPFNIVGRTNEGPFTGGAGVHFAVAGYFDTFEIKVVRGRAFNDSDTASSPPVIIINEALAKQFWKDGADPLADQMLVAGGAMQGVHGRARAPGHRHCRRCTCRQHRARSRADDVRADRANAGHRQRADSGHDPHGLGHPHEHRPGNRLEADPRHRSGDDRRARDERPEHGRRRLAEHFAAAAEHAADDDLRRLGARARCDRHLRSHGLLGAAPHAGDRHSHGARRAGRPSPLEHRRAGHDARRRRHRRRRRRRVLPRHVPRGRALRRQGARRRWCSSACRPCSQRRRSRLSGSLRGARAAYIRSRRCATNSGGEIGPSTHALHFDEAELGARGETAHGAVTGDVEFDVDAYGTPLGPFRKNSVSEVARSSIAIDGIVPTLCANSLPFFNVKSTVKPPRPSYLPA